MEARATYRPDIDGLRAIAVVAVIAHHLGASWLPGGFTGVDIFFVISGFLITGLIHGEAQRGVFSIRRFYQRRINRLMPALSVVLIVSAVAGLVLLAPHDLVLFAQSAFFTVVGSSNVFFWREYGNYFGSGADEAVLLHTWTLAVEEQFYLVWPWVLLLASRVLSRYLLVVALGVTAVALVVSEVGVQQATSASYYLLPTRFFELAIGGTLALHLSGGRVARLTTATGAGLIGLLLLGMAFVALTPDSPFPGINALLPCIGSALLIYAGTNQRSVTARLLGWGPLVLIGLMSYSMYLWHWPLIAYSRYLGIAISPAAAVVISIMVLVLSMLTWRFVEVPFRRHGAGLAFRRVLFRRFAFPVGVAAMVAVVVTLAVGFPGRYYAAVTTAEAMVATHPEELRSGCHVPAQLYLVQPSDTCRLGDDKANITGILLGDSFANHFSGMVDEMARHEGWALIDYTMDACPALPGYTTPVASYADKCRARNDAAFELAVSRGYKHVVLASDWPAGDETGALVKSALDRLLNGGAAVTIILANPAIPDGASCPIRNLMYPIRRTCTIAEPARPAYWDSIQADFPGVTFLDPSALICPKAICDPVLDGVLMYRDDNHLDDVGSRLLGKKFIALGTRLSAAQTTR